MYNYNLLPSDTYASIAVPPSAAAFMIIISKIRVKPDCNEFLLCNFSLFKAWDKLDHLLFDPFYNSLAQLKINAWKEPVVLYDQDSCSLLKFAI